MNVEMPDGTIISDVPEGTTKAQLLAKYERYQSPPQPSFMQQATSAASGLMPPALIPMTRAGAMQGLGDPFFQAGQLMENVPTVKMLQQGIGALMGTKPKSMREITKAREQAYARQRSEAGQTGVDVPRIAGNIVSTLPVGLVAGVPKTIGQALLQGGKMGAVGGALQPYTGEGNLALETGKQAGIGAGVGAGTGGLLYGGAKVGQALSNIVSPVLDVFRKEGPANIARRGYERFLGQPNIPPVVSALQQAKPIIPGSTPTAAEAVAGIPEGSPVQALQNIVAKREGGPSVEFGKRLLAQQQAREQAIGGIAKPYPTQAMAEKTRSALTSPLYEKAKEQIVPTDKNLQDILSRPGVQDAMKMAETTLQNKGVKLPTSKQAIPMLKLHETKLAIDQQLNKMKLEGAANSSAYQSLQDAKKALVGWMEKTSPSYGLARRTYEQASGPVNRVQVREALQDKLRNVTGKETPGTFLKAIDEPAKMLKTSTGYPRYTELEQVLKPQEAQTARSVARDLERSVAARNPLQPTDIKGMGSLTDEDIIKLHFLSRPVVAANSLLNYIGKEGVEPKVFNLMQRHLLNPQDLAAFLAQGQQPMSPYYQQMLAALLNIPSATAGGVGARP